MKLAGREEHKIAIAKGNTCLGGPVITVILVEQTCP